MDSTRESKVKKSVYEIAAVNGKVEKFKVNVLKECVKEKYILWTGSAINEGLCVILAA